MLNMLAEAKLILESEGLEIIEEIFRKYPSVLHCVRETFIKELNLRNKAVMKILENLHK